MNTRFKIRTSTTYPLLLEGSRVGREYGLGRENYVVIDHEGIIRYRTPPGVRLGAGFDDMAIRRSITEALVDLNDALETEARLAAEAQAAAEAAEAEAQAEAEAEAAAEAAQAVADSEAETAMESDAEAPTGMTAVLGEEAVPDAFALLGNYPNPFNANTVIRFRLAQAGPANLGIYDVQGRLVRHLQSGRLASGEHEVRWDGRDRAGRSVASGVYLYRLETAERRQARKMLLLQ